MSIVSRARWAPVSHDTISIAVTITANFTKMEVVSRNPKYLLVLLNLFFAFLAIAGQVGENVSLTLWADAASSNCSVHRYNTTNPDLVMDPYFILSFASLSFVVFFGCATLLQVLVQVVMGREDKKYINSTDLSFPQWQFVLIGVCDALNGVLVVFASPPKRTAPFLQSILGNIVIPLTIVARSVLIDCTCTHCMVHAHAFIWVISTYT